MPKTKVLEFQVGDIVLSKTYGDDILLITEKANRTEPYRKYKHWYTAFSLTTSDTYGIYTDINNKHYKILSVENDG